jgi:hypothetical protein
VNTSLQGLNQINSFADILVLLGVDNYQPPLVNVQVITPGVQDIINLVKDHPDDYPHMTHWKGIPMVYFNRQQSLVPRHHQSETRS